MLYYEGHPTPSIRYDASEEDVRAALSTIPVIQGVDVEFSMDSSGACNSTAINIIQASHFDVLSLGKLFRYLLISLMRKTCPSFS